MAEFTKLRYHVVDDPEVTDDVAGKPAATFRGVVPAELEPVAGPGFNNDESAARFYLDKLMVGDDRPAMRGVLAADRPELVPSLRLESQQELPSTNTKLVRFSQTDRSIPIFGSRAVVELTPQRSLVSAEASVQDQPDVPAVESIGRAQALQRIAAATGSPIADELAAQAELQFFKDDGGEWHLVWYFRGLPVAPPDAGLGDSKGHGFGRRPFVSYDYLVDAHDGEIVFSFSAVPTMSPIPSPVKCSGIGDDNENHDFWGSTRTQIFEMFDPLRHTRTFDLGGQDVAHPTMPNDAIGSPSSDFATSNRGGVSAHVNAMRVQDFYKSVLQRNGIDDAGMELVSLVNCTDPSQEQPPQFMNAFWWDKRMWYGQVDDGNGRLVSLSKHLDVIGHELTHGVVEFTSALVYKDQSGALNESFADIFGIIIKNWYLATSPKDVASWNWEMGAGLRDGGAPLRDFADPTTQGQPAHMNDYHQTTRDSGGVHTNSGIPNKAAYNVLTATDANGDRVFEVEDAALLFYLAMARLTPLATFSDTRQAMIDSAKSYYTGSSNRDEKVQAISDAYTSVGIN